MTRRQNKHVVIKDLFCDECGYPIDSCICDPIEHQERRQHGRNKKEKRRPISNREKS
jgi:Na+-translocating ferredoxin:NAD+ oxidoreductase RNF subunit RnfB